MDISEISVRRLEHNDAVPYSLLLDADPSKELVESYLKSADVFVAVRLGDIIGVYLLCPIDPDKAEIKNIAVREELQGQGIGKLLLEDAARQARANGYKALFIGTGNSSVGQLYLYQKAGFEITEIKKNFFIDNYTGPLYENGIQVKHMIMLVKKL